MVKLLRAPMPGQAVAGKLTDQLLMMMFRLLMPTFTLTLMLEDPKINNFSWEWDYIQKAEIEVTWWTILTGGSGWGHSCR